MFTRLILSGFLVFIMGKCHFSEHWLREENYKTWLARVDEWTARCKLCCTKIDLSNMGEGALKSHTKSKKHIRLQSRQNQSLDMSMFLTRKYDTDGATSSSTNTACDRPAAMTVVPRAKTNDLVTTVTTNQTLEAEVIWCLKLNQSHWSYKSSEATGQIFRNMFPDSQIAQKFQCGERKAAYITAFGIAPHFKRLLSQKLKEQDSGFVLLFDESLNTKTQSKQMDIHVRIWDFNTVSTRYYTSEFMGHATAEDMLNVFNKVTDGMKLKSLLQLSMDGPNVKWKFYGMVQARLESDVNSSLLNTGSCGLHILHGAFKKAADVPALRVDQFLSSAYYHLKDSPARREDFAKATEQTKPVMPLKFCKTRWVENVSVAERLEKILPDLKKYVKAIESGKYPNPDTKSYHVIRDGCQDALMPVKLAFHIPLAKEVTDFLKKYQTEKPVLPFLATDLFQVLKSIMTRFLKSEIMNKIKTITKLFDIDVTDKDLHKRPSKIDVGFTTDKLLKQLTSAKKNAKISEKKKLEFRLEVKGALLVLVQKLMDKSPLQYTLVRNIKCLDPHALASKDQETNVSRMKKVLQVLVEAGRIQEGNCDEILRQYRIYISEIVSCRKAQFTQFDSITDRLDTLFYETMASNKTVDKLWKVVQVLLLLSHGNASVERGFSVNRQVEVENLKETTYVAQRTICDHIKAVGSITDVAITKELLLSAAGARQRYHAYLDEMKRLKETEAKAQKRKTLTDDIDEIKKKKRRLEEDSKSLLKAADEFALKAERTGKLTFISKSNSMRRTAKEKETELEEISSELDRKLQELKNS